MPKASITALPELAPDCIHSSPRSRMPPVRPSALPEGWKRKKPLFPWTAHRPHCEVTSPGGIWRRTTSSCPEGSSGGDRWYTIENSGFFEQLADWVMEQMTAASCPI